MRIEAHVLQNFAPSNLNRDDTGSPKDAEFGGHRRARVSSQCLKRAVRLYFEKEQLLDTKYLAERTKRFAKYIADALSPDKRKKEDAWMATLAVLGTQGIRPPGDQVKSITGQVEKDESEITEPLTSYLIFASNQELLAVKEIVHNNWDTLTAKPFVKKLLKELATGDLSKRKAAVRKLVGDAINKQMDTVFAKGAIGTAAGDLALFGRMLADLPENNIDAACQVAHCISTNKIHSMEMDYYTAVDDLKPDDTAGADMIGTVEFNSACFYRYANLDVGQLATNLQGDGELAKKTAEAFLKAFVHAIPTGKQNTFAAHNPPSLVFITVRRGSPVSLANAFVEPARPDHAGDLILNSIRKLDRYYGIFAPQYGADDRVVGAVWCQFDNDEIWPKSEKKTVEMADSLLKGFRKATWDAAIKAAVAAAFPGGEA
jgi:CRISPR system Cascade subunit CasC